MTARDKPSRFVRNARVDLVAQLEKARLPRTTAKAWAKALSGQTLRYQTSDIVARVLGFHEAVFPPVIGVPYLEAGFSPKESREATHVFGRTVADLNRLYAAAAEAVRIANDHSDYYVFDKAALESEVATLMCSHVPVHEAEVLLRTGASSLWAVWTHAECQRDNDPERWTKEMFLVYLGAQPIAPENPPDWWDQWRSEVTRQTPTSEP